MNPVIPGAIAYIELLLYFFKGHFDILLLTKVYIPVNKETEPKRLFQNIHQFFK